MSIEIRLDKIMNDDPTNKKIEQETDVKEILPIVPLRDIVVYPYMAVPIFVGRAQSIEAINDVYSKEKKILLVTQKKYDIEEIKEKNLYLVGTYAKILQLIKLPDNTYKVLVEGIQRTQIKKFEYTELFLTGHIKLIKTINNLSETHEKSLLRSLLSSFKQLIDISHQLPKEVISSILSDNKLSRVIDTMASQIPADIIKKQKILEEHNIETRASLLLKIVISEIEILKLESKIKDSVKSQIERNQREYYLNEKIKAIYKEIGEVDEHKELEDLEIKIKQTKMSKEAENKALYELKKLKSMPSTSAESSVSRNYIETLINLPWSKRSKIKKDINYANTILNKEHYGLKKVKERILEYLAVQNRIGNKFKNSPIICLVGPPGVGKTSLGKSIALSTGRKYIRMSLGGIKDEAEIRGHRRTYIGAIPGQIIQKISKSKVKNPLFILDEIDKMSSDFRGDPASAMLEVLDPEQNYTFNDHYLDVDYDLSEVMFIATANTLNIPDALRDRMEVIHISSYSEEEKFNIASKFLLPKSIKYNGLKNTEFYMDETIFKDIIYYYTRESGVRILEQKINQISRKILKQILTNKYINLPIIINSNNLNQYLGIRRYHFGLINNSHKVGQVTGLAWTQVGGDLLNIEAVTMSGKGKFKITGQLGKVMEESIYAAFTVVRTKSIEYNLEHNFYKNLDFHIHVPEGSIPKDGPSAGITMCTAMLSVLTNIPVNREIAMTGEITLSGDILAIGGLKEKLLAAMRGGIKKVIIPYSNNKDLIEIPHYVKDKLQILPLKNIDEVFKYSLIKNS